MPTIHELLAAGADGDAAIGSPGGPDLSYGALRAQVERLAGQLAALDLTPADRVAFVLPNGPEMATTFLALASCTAAAPLNPKYREDEFRFYLEDLDAKALVTFPDGAPAARAALPAGAKYVELIEDGGSLALRYEGTVPAPAAPTYGGPDDVALFLHTSGTTSRPKLVPLRNRNLAASAANIAAGLALTAQDRCLNPMPLFHIHGLVAGLLAPIAAGGTVICPPGGFDPFKFFDWLAQSKPTWYTAVPTMHQVILSRAGRYTDVIADLPLRFVRSSSASLPTVVLEEIDRVFGVPMIEAYGMTEASHQMASNPLPPAPRKPGSVGRGTGIEITILDAEGNELPIGTRGEVAIKGRTVIDGYEHNPDANATAFTNGWFRTGDQGYFDEDGYLFLTGRLKEIINRGGEKVSPLEVDEVLLRHPGVTQCVTFALPHPKLGEEVAAAVVTGDDAPTEQELRAFAGQHLTDFKVPRKIVFLDEIPKGPTGKMQRIGLAERLGLV